MDSVTLSEYALRVFLALNYEQSNIRELKNEYLYPIVLKKRDQARAGGGSMENIRIGLEDLPRDYRKRLGIKGDLKGGTSFKFTWQYTEDQESPQLEDLCKSLKTRLNRIGWAESLGTEEKAERAVSLIGGDQFTHVSDALGKPAERETVREAELMESVLGKKVENVEEGEGEDKKGQNLLARERRNNLTREWLLRLRPGLLNLGTPFRKKNGELHQEVLCALFATDKTLVSDLFTS